MNDSDDLVFVGHDVSAHLCTQEAKDLWRELNINKYWVTLYMDSRDQTYRISLLIALDERAVRGCGVTVDEAVREVYLNAKLKVLENLV